MIDRISRRHLTVYLIKQLWRGHEIMPLELRESSFPATTRSRKGHCNRRELRSMGMHREHLGKRLLERNNFLTMENKRIFERISISICLGLGEI